MTNARYALNLHQLTTPSAVPGGDTVYGPAYATYTIWGPAACALHTAVSNGDLEAVDTALSNGVDVDHVVLGFTPLAIAALDRDEDMMLKLLSHNADPHTAYILLRQNGISHPGAFAALQSCAEVSPRLQEAIGRLRGDFLRELSTISPKVAMSRRKHRRLVVMASATKAQHRRRSFSGVIDNIKCLSGSWSIALDRHPEVAWNKCLSVLRNLMRGRLPTEVDEVLLLLVLARSMAPQVVAGRNQEAIEAELKIDMSRWLGLFKDDWSRSQCFQDAAKTLFSVNLSEPMLNPIVGLKEALYTLQPLAQKLVRQVNRHLGQRYLGHGVVLFVAHARCLSGSADGDTHNMDEQAVDQHHIQHHTYGQDHDFVHRGRRRRSRAPHNHASQPPHRNHEAATSPSAFAEAANMRNQLVLLFAGVVFGIIVAFLSVVRSILHSSVAYVNPYDHNVQEIIAPVTLPPISIDYPWLPQVILRTAGLLDGYIRDGSRPCTRCSGVSPLRAQRRRQYYNTLNRPTGNPITAQYSARQVDQNGIPPNSTKKTYCDICERDYWTTPNYGKHYREIHEKVRYRCIEPGCASSYVRNDALTKHIARHHPGSSPVVRTRRRRRSRQPMSP